VDNGERQQETRFGGITAPWTRTEEYFRIGFSNWVHVNILKLPGVGY
jgi:hypothetical protein